MKNKISIVVLLLAFAVTGFLLGQSMSVSPWVQTPQNLTDGQPVVSLMVDHGDGGVSTYQDVPLGNPPTVHQALVWLREQGKIQLDTKHYENVGVLITRIDTKTNGQDNKFWQYWVNNSYVQVAADKYLLNTGDVVEWKFVGQQPFTQN